MKFFEGLRNVVYFVFVIYALFWAFSAFAGEATLSWTAPTQNTDGTPLTDLDGFKVYYGPTPTPSLSIDITDETLTQYVITGLVPGTWYFAMTAYNAKGVESGLSEQVSKTISGTAPPQPPSGLTVQQGNLVVYTVVKRPDRFALVPVGTVPEGTACDTSQSVNGYYAVPTAAVVWSGNIRPAVVVAQCG